MGELFQEFGMFAVEHMPFTLGFVGAVIAFALWGAHHAYENTHKGQLWCCCAVVVVTVPLVPWAYSSTKDYCRDLVGTYAITTETTLPPELRTTTTSYPGYVTSRCATVWPSPTDLLG